MPKIVGPLEGLSRSGPNDYSQNSENLPRSGLHTGNPYAPGGGQSIRDDMLFGQWLISGTASGSADTTGTATGTVSSVGGVNGTATGSADTTGSATGKVAVSGAASGAADTTGAATGAVRVSGQASGNADTTGTATGTVSSAAITGQASGTADTTGSATGTVTGGNVVVIDRTDAPKRKWHEKLRDEELARLEQEIAELKAATPAKRKRKAREISREIVADMPSVEPVRQIAASLKALSDDAGWWRRHIQEIERAIAELEEVQRRRKRNDEAALLLLIG